MATDERAGVDHHVSGLYVNMLMDSLAARLSPESIADVLRRAGETRTVDELNTSSSWSSYDEFRRLLEEASAAMASVPETDHESTPPDLLTTEIAGAIQGLGTPAEVFAANTGSNPLVPIRRYETAEIERNTWEIRESFIEGFDPYPEYCEFIAAQFRMIPLFFGLQPAEVTEESCQCRGDAACVFRVSWDEVDEVTASLEYLEARAQNLEARLEQLQGMITDLASNERYEDVLQGIVGSTMEAVLAGGAVLALEPRAGFPGKVYSEGLTAGEAAEIAEALLAGGVDHRPILSAPVTSSRRHYGVLAIGEHGGLFAAQAQATLDTHARLAAATLDAADALEEARHQATTAEVLLGLSTSLAEIVSLEEMATKVVRAVPDVIDCDRAALLLDHGDWHDPSSDGFELMASFGYSEEVGALILGRCFSAEEFGVLGPLGLVARTYNDIDTDTAVSVSAPISVAGTTIGFIVASVTADPDRLTITNRLADRLKGLAAQASIAINNARLVDQIRYQALHDPLTGLPNRSLILDRTEQMLARAHRSFEPVAALFIDLDGFKDVNDTLGHGVGDQLLRAVAERLSVTMRASDSIGRLGGDEFVVLVEGTTMDSGPELVADRVLEVLRSPFQLEGASGGAITLTASIGIAVGTRSTAAELLRDADIALYEAKAFGKNCFVVFQPEMHTAVQDHHLLQMDLRDALSSNQFFLVYQPILNLRSGAVIGVEALLRWRHPARGVVQPDDFIPMLEDSGMIVDVGRWVLDEACRQGAEWKAQGYDLSVSVNVSARQLESDRLIGDVEQTLRDSGLEPGSLTIEITETALMRNVSEVVPRLEALKTTGVRIAIDDFGTGYSSLAYLQRFPVDTLKIDRTFIASMAESPEASALIRTLVQLGKTLGLETLAEGIEEHQQYLQLEREECDSGQGYLFARPLEAEAVVEFLSTLPVKGDPTLEALAGPS
jgi:diguanylate cyclase (GGDEF)-like protein